LDVPLRVAWFDAMRGDGIFWVPGNILGRPLDSQVFSAWYSDGDPIVDGVIPPKGVAVCGTNWHGSAINPILGPIKWAYRAVDPSGGFYYAEYKFPQHMMLDVSQLENIERRSIDD
jgi:hypothetical protein